ncbi:hypothetical protein F2P81_011091 [Scophthalmus maximus]|uniref:Uncharacterized protein n=1 Tax=Scophthalmus maximus TaxID=52904 RepID=A0A6A4SSV3_SCOMX|nr:hypothetical protein F2P81_011091 [Scophthalmus maximus]
MRIKKTRTMYNARTLHGMNSEAACSVCYGFCDITGIYDINENCDITGIYDMKENCDITGFCDITGIYDINENCDIIGFWEIQGSFVWCILISKSNSKHIQKAYST